MSSSGDLGQQMRSLVESLIERGIRLDEAHEQLERHFLSSVMSICSGNQSRAAAQLQLHRNTLRRKLERHGLL